MKAVILCSLVAVVAVSALVPLPETAYQSQFVKFMQDYSKAYESPAETFNRFNLFKANLDFVRAENAKNMTYWLGINEFSDLSDDEFLATHTGHLGVDNSIRDEIELTGEEANDVDWRGKGAVTPIKNQGSCGSCWAFSATGAVEGYWFLKQGSLISFSEQQLVDCCKSSCSGCNGGQESNAIAWSGQKGQCKGADYPYTGRDGSCKSTCTPVAKGFGVKRAAGEASLVSGLNSLPVAVAVAANAWRNYKGGVFSGPCPGGLNHAVLAVGYTADYFIVKNSWGTSWGTSGYIYMKRGMNPSLCGVGKEPSWPQ